MTTRSAKGMTVVSADGVISHLDAEAKEVFDVSGAGDTVVATVAAALAMNADLNQAAARRKPTSLSDAMNELNCGVNDHDLIRTVKLRKLG